MNLTDDERRMLAEACTTRVIGRSRTATALVNKGLAEYGSNDRVLATKAGRELIEHRPKEPTP